MTVVVDSSVLIPVERGEIDLGVAMVSAPDAELVMSAISVSELLHGAHRAKSVVSRARTEARIERILSAMPVIEFDVEIARVHAALGADLRSRGQVMGAHDLIIAATAVWLDAPVATRDVRGFGRVKGLEILRW